MTRNQHTTVAGSATRCYGITGTASHGPAYCGRPARDHDPNGRPICGHHRQTPASIEWHGDTGNYPTGTRGNWKFTHGPARPTDRLSPGRHSQ